MAAHTLNRTNSFTTRPGRHRRGSVIVYTIFMLTVLFGMAALAVDYARAALAKTELQRAADNTARAMLASYAVNGSTSTANTVGTNMTASGYNPIDSGSGVNPTVTRTWGYWNPTLKTFTAYSFSPPAGMLRAVKVMTSRTATNSNGVPLVFGRVVGRTTVDVWASAVAALTPTQNVNFTVDPQGDPWLAGMTSGSASYNDTAPSDTPASILSVTPGTTLTFSNVTGLVNHTPSSPVDDPNGRTGSPYSHMMDSPDGDHNGVQNGIGDVVMPIDSMLGLFLDNNAPNTTAAPSVVRDYSTQSARDQVATTDLLTKQPFFVGDGQTSTGTTKTYTVPPGATRLYLGIMDGYEWNNNNGSFTGTITISWSVALVQ